MNTYLIIWPYTPWVNNMELQKMWTTPALHFFAKHPEQDSNYAISNILHQIAMSAYPTKEHNAIQAIVTTDHNYETLLKLINSSQTLLDDDIKMLLTPITKVLNPMIKNDYRRLRVTGISTAIDDEKNELFHISNEVYIHNDRKIDIDTTIEAYVHDGKIVQIHIVYPSKNIESPAP